MSALTRHDAGSFRRLVAGARRFVEPDLDGEQSERLEALFGRALGADEAVREIVDDVRRRGDAAL
ncbi:MAG: hypothetical protein JWM18_868, partial [Chloroflexi bacterium]|nr:hypothetical protein [Chloroflexota bacterium]